MNKLLSLCMIVKNEEDALATCLDSVRGLADEIVIVDTGSTDRTLSIAAQYTDCIFHFEWTGNFAEARNEALRKATGRWILVLDADEYVEDNDGKHKLRTFLESANPRSPIGYYVPILNYVGERNAGKVSESTMVRLFPNDSHIRYARPIHEQLVHDTVELELIAYPLTIHHTGYTADTIMAKNKSQRNMAIFETMREREELGPYDDYSLGNEYMAIRDYAQAVVHYNRAWSTASPEKSWLPACYMQSIRALMELNRYREAWQHVDEALRRWRDYADFHWSKADLLVQLGFDRLAEEELLACIRLSEKEQNDAYRCWLISPNYATTLPYQQLAVLYLQQQRIQDAVTCLTKLLYANPNHLAVLSKLVQLLLQHETPEVVIRFLTKHYASDEGKYSLLLLEAAILSGNAYMCSHYLNLSMRLGNEVPTSLVLRCAIITGNKEAFDRALKQSLSGDAAHINESLCLAACLWSDRCYREAIVYHEDGSHLDYASVLDLIMHHDAGTSGSQTDTDCNPTVIVSILMGMFRDGHYEGYDRLIRLFPNAYDTLANRLGDFFYTENRLELAIDYYSVLLDNDQLAATGYENLARLYLSQGELADGLAFLAQAIDRNENRPSLYTLFLQYSDDAQAKASMMRRFAAKFPDGADLPFIRELVSLN